MLHSSDRSVGSVPCLTRWCWAVSCFLLSHWDPTSIVTVRYFGSVRVLATFFFKDFVETSFLSPLILRNFSGLWEVFEFCMNLQNLIIWERENCPVYKSFDAGKLIDDSLLFVKSFQIYVLEVASEYLICQFWVLMFAVKILNSTANSEKVLFNLLKLRPIYVQN